jgi:hypothetical protein
MLELSPEGKTYIVWSKRENGKFSMGLTTWAEVEEYIANEPGVYKIMSVESYEIPLTGLKLKS